jgi:hypothetical protein
MLSIELGGACRGSALVFVKATMKMQADIANPRIMFSILTPATLTRFYSPVFGQRRVLINCVGWCCQRMSATRFRRVRNT